LTRVYTGSFTCLYWLLHLRLEFPAGLKDKITFDSANKLLVSKGEMSAAEEQQLLGLSKVAAYQQAIKDLGTKSRTDPDSAILNSPPDQPPFVVRDLQFWIGAPEVSDTTQLLDFSKPFGFGSPLLGDFLVSSSESELLHLPGIIEEGE